jgi:hypothetical protein
MACFVLQSFEFEFEQYKELKPSTVCIGAQRQEEEGGGEEEGRGEGSASLQIVSLMRARCTTLHKHCATKLCLPTSASFKRVQQRLCCGAGGESRSIAALQGGNSFTLHASGSAVG